MEQTERRQETSILLTLMQTIHEDVKSMSRRLDANSAKLEAHMEEEEDELDAIRVQINVNKEQSENRHEALLKSITSYMDKSIDLEEAFLKDHEGKPDLRGHYEDHSYRKKVSDFLGDAWGGAFKKAFEYGVLAGLAWIGYELWIAFLRGPK